MADFFDELGKKITETATMLKSMILRAKNMASLILFVFPLAQL